MATETEATEYQKKVADLLDGSSVCEMLEAIDANVRSEIYDVHNNYVRERVFESMYLRGAICDIIESYEKVRESEASDE